MCHGMPRVANRQNSAAPSRTKSEIGQPMNGFTFGTTGCCG
jgi:hypothetical protein